MAEFYEEPSFPEFMAFRFHWLEPNPEKAKEMLDWYAQQYRTNELKKDFMFYKMTRGLDREVMPSVLEDGATVEPA